MLTLLFGITSNYELYLHGEDIVTFLFWEVLIWRNDHKDAKHAEKVMLSYCSDNGFVSRRCRLAQIMAE
jgi:hypothetical protein